MSCCRSTCSEFTGPSKRCFLPPGGTIFSALFITEYFAAGRKICRSMEQTRMEFIDRAAVQKRAYTQAMQAGAGVVDIANGTAAELVSSSAVLPEDRQTVWGLIIDLVHDTELVELVEQIRSAE